MTSKLSSVSLGFLVVSRTGKTQYNEPLKIGHHGDRGDWLVAVMGRWGSNMAPASFSYSKSATFLIFLKFSVYKYVTQSKHINKTETETKDPG